MTLHKSKKKVSYKKLKIVYHNYKITQNSIKGKFLSIFVIILAGTIILARVTISDYCIISARVSDFDQSFVSDWLAKGRILKLSRNSRVSATCIMWIKSYNFIKSFYKWFKNNSIFINPYSKITLIFIFMAMCPLRNNLKMVSLRWMWHLSIHLLF